MPNGQKTWQLGRCDKKAFRVGRPHFMKTWHIKIKHREYIYITTGGSTSPKGVFRGLPKEEVTSKVIMCIQPILINQTGQNTNYPVPIPAVKISNLKIEKIHNMRETCSFLSHMHENQKSSFLKTESHQPCGWTHNHFHFSSEHNESILFFLFCFVFLFLFFLILFYLFKGNQPAVFNQEFKDQF